MQRRHQVLLNRQSRPDEGGATTALTDEVAYDAALIRQAGGDSESTVIPASSEGHNTSVTGSNKHSGPEGYP